MSAKHGSFEDKLAATADYLQAIEAKLIQMDAKFDTMIVHLAKIATNTTPKK